MEKEKIISFIENRINAEHRKHYHSGIQWDKIAAIKIYDELLHLNVLHPEQSNQVNNCTCSRCTGLPDIESYYKDDKEV